MKRGSLLAFCIENLSEARLVKGVYIVNVEI